MGERKRKLNEQLDRLEDELPEPAAKPVRKLRRPDWKWVRIPTGVLLLIAGLISLVPLFNWKIALGVALLAIDVPFLRTPATRLMRWILDKWKAVRDRLRGHGEARAPRP